MSERSCFRDPTADAAIGSVMRDMRAERDRKYRVKNRRKIYVASPFAGDTRKNTAAALRYCRFVINEGYLPVASHIMYAASGMLRDSVPKERELGMLLGLGLLRSCHEVWVFGEPSPGMEQEIREAEMLGKPIRYFDEQMQEVTINAISS